MNESAHDFWLTAWQQVQRAQHDSKHAFRTPVISSVTQQGLPNARTVVMRKADSDNYELWLYTDCRSTKFSELRLQSSNSEGRSNDQRRRSQVNEQSQEQGAAPSLPSPHLHWLFWSPRKNLQLGTGGPVRLLPEQETTVLFNQLPKHSRKTYATLLPPGTPQDKVTDGLQDNWNELDVAQTDYARQNFRVIITTLQYADVLHLDRAGNRRVKALRQTDGDWDASWVIP